MEPHENELLSAVDDLTLPRNVKVETDEGLTWATEDALLVQLEEAISSTTGRSGGRSLGHERMILDADALMRFHQITAAIGDWCRIEGTNVTRNPVKDLRAWHARRIGRPVTERTGDEFYINQLHDWANLIRGKMRPKRQWEIKRACPECDNTTWTDEEGDEFSHPLVVEFDPDAPLASAKWSCRNCGAGAEGVLAQRALAYNLETRDQEETTTV